MSKKSGETTSKKSKTGYYLITAIVFIILGVLTIMYRNQIAEMTDNIIKWVVAGVFAIVAVINIIQFAKNPGKTTIGDLAIGVLALIAMVVMLVASGMFLWLVRIMFGLYLAYEGVMKAVGAFKCKKGTVKAWYVPLILGVLSVIAGVLIVLNPFKTTTIFFFVVGLVLVYAGIQNAVSLFIKPKNN